MTVGVCVQWCGEVDESWSRRTGVVVVEVGVGLVVQRGERREKRRRRFGWSWGDRDKGQAVERPWRTC